MIDAVGIVHMNGRVYDPFLGRMLSADPTVPGPFNSQAFNRYSYVLNSPMSFVDPSGFSPLGLCGGGICHKVLDGSGGWQRNWTPPAPSAICDNTGCHFEPYYGNTNDVVQIGDAPPTSIGTIGFDDEGDSTTLDQMDVYAFGTPRAASNSAANSSRTFPVAGLAALMELMNGIRPFTIMIPGLGRHVRGHFGPLSGGLGIETFVTIGPEPDFGIELSLEGGFGKNWGLDFEPASVSLGGFFVGTGTEMGGLGSSSTAGYGLHVTAINNAAGQWQGMSVSGGPGGGITSTRDLSIIISVQTVSHFVQAVSCVATPGCH